MKHVAGALGARVRLLPVTDDPLRTKVVTDEGELDFQQWFVARRHADPVRSVRYHGADEARPALGVLEAIGEADLVVIAPSNPFVSIRPILAVPGIEDALANKRVAAISPLVSGKAIRGPLAEMMTSLGHEPSARRRRAVRRARRRVRDRHPGSGSRKRHQRIRRLPDRCRTRSDGRRWAHGCWKRSRDRHHRRHRRLRPRPGRAASPSRRGGRLARARRGTSSSRTRRRRSAPTSSSSLCRPTGSSSCAATLPTSSPAASS